MKTKPIERFREIARFALIVTFAIVGTHSTRLHADEQLIDLLDRIIDDAPATPGKLPDPTVKIAKLPEPISQHEFVVEPVSHPPAIEEIGNQFLESGVLENFLHFQFEAFFVSRSDLSDHDFVFDDNGPSLNNKNLDFGVTSGYRTRLMLRNPIGEGIDISYTRVSDLDSTNVVNGPNVTPEFFAGIPATPVSSYDVKYVSQFRDLEANAWKSSHRFAPALSWGIGVRAMEVREKFDILQSAATVPTGFFSYSENKLIGGQVGAEMMLPVRDDLTLDLGGRFGLFNNNTFVRAVALNTRRTWDEDQFTTAGSFDAGVVWHPDRNIKVRAGYHGIFVDQLALAPDASANMSIFTPGDIYYSSIYYGGAYVGIDFVY